MRSLKALLPRPATSALIFLRRFSARAPLSRTSGSTRGRSPTDDRLCPMRFAEKNKVAPHEQTHTGEKAYACPMWNQTVNHSPGWMSRAAISAPRSSPSSST